MAEPLPVDTALCRLDVYADLLSASDKPGERQVASDILALIAWIRHVRPLLGAVAPDSGLDEIGRRRRETTEKVRSGLAELDKALGDKPAA